MSLKKRIICILVFCMSSSLLGKEWALWNGKQIPLPEAYRYSLFVLEKGEHSLMKIFHHHQTKVLKYVDLKKIAEENPLYQKGILSKEFIPSFIQDILPQYLFERFHGIYLKTEGLLDFPKEIELFVNSIRYQYPEILIVVEGNAKTLSKVIDKIDGASIASLESFYDPKEKKYRLQNKDVADAEYKEIQMLMKNMPGLPFYSLDFWDGENKEAISSIVKKQKERGFIPFVTNYLMDMP